jgi:hypothetical protein
VTIVARFHAGVSGSPDGDLRGAAGPMGAVYARPGSRATRAGGLIGNVAPSELDRGAGDVIPTVGLREQRLAQIDADHARPGPAHRLAAWPSVFSQS